MTPTAAHSRTRVCHVVESLEHAGAESLVCTLAVGMRHTPYAPLVCCMRTGPLAADLERHGVLVECLDIPRQPAGSGMAFVRFVWRLVRELRRVVSAHDVGVLHAHMQDAVVWATVAGLLERTAVVGTYHGLGVLPTNRSRLDPRNAVRRRLYRWAARRSNRTIAVSPAVHALLCDELGFPESKTVTVINGVDTQVFGDARDNGRVRAELGLTDRRIVLCVSRLNPGKGQNVLLDAFASVRARMPDAVLVLVGDGPSRKSLEARTRELGLETSVVLASHRTDIADLLATASVFVLPSFSEGISLSLLEALAAGAPVIATNVPGNLAVLGKASTVARLVPPGDAPALADTLIDLLKHPDAAAAMGLAGQMHVRTHFDITRVFDRMAAIYAEVLAEQQRSGPRPA